jgi:hypothetical protein
MTYFLLSLSIIILFNISLVLGNDCSNEKVFIDVLTMEKQKLEVEMQNIQDSLSGFQKILKDHNIKEPTVLKAYLKERKDLSLRFSRNSGGTGPNPEDIAKMEEDIIALKSSLETNEEIIKNQEIILIENNKTIDELNQRSLEWLEKAHVGITACNDKLNIANEKVEELISSEISKIEVAVQKAIKSTNIKAYSQAKSDYNDLLNDKDTIIKDLKTWLRLAEQTSDDADAKVFDNELKIHQLEEKLLQTEQSLAKLTLHKLNSNNLNSKNIIVDSSDIINNDIEVNSIKLDIVSNNDDDLNIIVSDVFTNDNMLNKDELNELNKSIEIDCSETEELIVMDKTKADLSLKDDLMIYDEEIIEDVDDEINDAGNIPIAVIVKENVLIEEDIVESNGEIKAEIAVESNNSVVTNKIFEEKVPVIIEEINQSEIDKLKILLSNAELKIKELNRNLNNNLIDPIKVKSKIMHKSPLPEDEYERMIIDSKVIINQQNAIVNVTNLEINGLSELDICENSLELINDENYKLISHINDTKSILDSSIRNISTLEIKVKIAKNEQKMAILSHEHCQLQLEVEKNTESSCESDLINSVRDLNVLRNRLDDVNKYIILFIYIL